MRRRLPEMLELLHSRMDNDREKELQIAADEQRKITHLRLEKLFGHVLAPASGGTLRR